MDAVDEALRVAEAAWSAGIVEEEALVAAVDNVRDRLRQIYLNEDQMGPLTLRFMLAQLAWARAVEARALQRVVVRYVNHEGELLRVLRRAYGPGEATQ